MRRKTLINFFRDRSNSDFTDSRSSHLTFASYSSQIIWQNGSNFNKQRLSNQFITNTSINENTWFYDLRKTYANKSSFLFCTNNVKNGQNIGSDETNPLLGA